MIEREEIKKMKFERGALFAALLFASAVALVAVLLVWKGQITGLQVVENEDIFCVDQSGLRFISGSEPTLSGETHYSYQLKLGCLPGKITFQDNSDLIDVSPTGLVKQRNGTEIPRSLYAIIIAEHESGKVIYKKFRFNTR